MQMSCDRSTGDCLPGQPAQAPGALPPHPSPPYPTPHYPLPRPAPQRIDGVTERLIMLSKRESKLLSPTSSGIAANDRQKTRARWGGAAAKEPPELISVPVRDTNPVYTPSERETTRRPTLQ